MSKDDIPNWHQVMNGSFSDKYWKAAEKEIHTLEGMGAWDVVEHEDDMNVIIMELGPSSEAIS